MAKATKYTQAHIAEALENYAIDPIFARRVCIATLGNALAHQFNGKSTVPAHDVSVAYAGLAHTSSGNASGKGA